MFDTHVHLNLEDFSQDRSEVLKRARDAGVTNFLNVGIDLGKSRQSVALAEKEENVFATVGLHPHDASKFSEPDFQEFKKLAKNKKVVAIGEVGLDYFRNLSPRDVQQKVFERFVGLATELGLPLVIHSREAYSDIYAVLRKFGSTHRGLMHCFAGTKEDLEEALALGLHISFAGPITYKKNNELRQLVAAVPEDRLLVETDAPFLPPEPYRGRRNEPAFMVETLKRMAEIRGVEPAEMVKVTTNNAKRLFHI